MNAIDPRQPLTWEDLIRLEPRLLDLIADAHAVAHEAADDWSYCRYRAWAHGYRGRTCFGRRVNELVGWETPHFGHNCLGGSKAWQLVFDKLMEILPARCACC